MSDIGAAASGWWQFWHFAWRMGATSFENVTSRVTVGSPAALATLHTPMSAAKTKGTNRKTDNGYRVILEAVIEFTILM